MALFVLAKSLKTALLTEQPDGRVLSWDQPGEQASEVDHDLFHGFAIAGAHRRPVPAEDADRRRHG